MDKDTLQKFCSVDEKREAIMQPWSDEVYSYATDGRIAVRIKTLFEIPPNPKAPKMETIFSPFSPGPDAKFTPCPQCLEESSFVKCETCHGNREHFCPECKSYHECGKCGGLGGKTVYKPVDVGNRKLSSKYLRLLSELNAELWLDRGEKDDVVYFRFSEGDGLLAPMKTD